jgi:hypothetical protein
MGASVIPTQTKPPASAVAGAAAPFGFAGKAPNAAAAMGALQEYMTDAWQRMILLLDILRERGNEQIEMTARELATVLTFDHEIIMGGASLSRPINYSLAATRHQGRSGQAPRGRHRPARQVHRVRDDLGLGFSRLGLVWHSSSPTLNATKNPMKYPPSRSSPPNWACQGRYRPSTPCIAKNLRRGRRCQP